MMPKRKDILVIVVALFLALLLYLVSRYMGNTEVSVVVARVNGEVVLQKSLLTDGRYEIPLPDGQVNIIRVEKGAVWMEEANCRDGLCIHQGKMRNRAKTIVCLPHSLVITVEGETVGQQTDEDDLDIIVY